MRDRVVDVGAVRLALAESGSGDHRVMLLHGFTADRDDVAGVLPALAGRGWHAVAPDLRGHGRSDHPADEAAYSLEAMAADVTALADSLGWDRFVLVGHSMGGAVAQVVALDHPQRLRGLVLASTFHGPVSGVAPALVELGTEIVRRSGMPGLAEAMAAYRSGDEASMAATARLETSSPGYAERAAQRLASTSAAMWLAMAPRFLAPEDRLARLGGLEVPTAVVVGRLDPAMLADSRRMAGAIPGAELHELDDCGHVPQVERPAEWWAILDGFLARV